MKSIEFRNNPLFLRNEHKAEGGWDYPIIKKQSLDLTNLQLISFSDISSSDSKNLHKGVHFFIDDWRFETLYNNPERSFRTLSRYRFVLSPDYSLYSEMPVWRQIESVGKSRWVGANWQQRGLIVIPTISWAQPRSFEYCFNGIEKHSIVAIGMIGCKKSRSSFMHGYNEMLNRIEPEAIICLGSPFPEMEGNIVIVDYSSFRKEVR